MLAVFLAGAVVLTAILHDGLWGLCYGVVIAYLIIRQQQLGHQLTSLQKLLQSLSSIPSQSNSQDLPTTPNDIEPHNETSVSISDSNTVAIRLESTQPARDSAITNSIFSHNIKQKIIDFFTYGNLIAKIGIILLFFGVSFLIKFVALHSKFPIEFRLAMASLLGVVLLFIGWRLRTKRYDYALVLQGGGIGVLYIVTYSAFRFYGLLPAEFTFLLLFIITVGAIALALLQNAQSLVYLAVLGGFLAPLLTASESRNPVGLFGYYTLLNVLIIIIARYKAWRPLNITGFYFTFIISAIWGYFSYKSEYFFITESFLMLFFLLYFALSILYTARQPLQFKGYVDATLVFGPPLMLCALQASLISHIQYGLAFNALVLGILYAIAATLLHRWDRSKFKLLSEVFAGLAIVLGTMTIPLTLSGQWTSVIWTIEAVCIIWLGIRQQRLLARVFGYLLQGFAQIIFGLKFSFVVITITVVNFYVLGAMLIALTNFITSWMLYQPFPKKRISEHLISVALFLLGIVWWSAGGLFEINHFVPSKLQLSNYLAFFIGNRETVPIYTALLFFTCSAIGIGLVNKRLSWQWLSYLALGLLPVMAVASFALLGHYHHYAWFPWCLVIICWYWVLKQQETLTESQLNPLHLLSAWFVVWQMAYSLSSSLTLLHGFSATWPLISWGLIPGMTLILFQRSRIYTVWPFKICPNAYRLYVSLGLVIFMMLWIFYSNVSSNGDAAPLHYLPVLNPLDLVCLFNLIMISRWYIAQQPLIIPKLEKYYFVKRFWLIISALTLFWFNMTLARSLHHYVGIPLTWADMFDSRIAQTAFSICWTIIAVIITFIAAKRSLRKLWFAGFVIICLVIIKLFLIDLMISSMLLRTVSFSVVGVLLLLIGYFCPMPPNSKKPQE